MRLGIKIGQRSKKKGKSNFLYFQIMMNEQMYELIYLSNGNNSN